MLIPETNSRLAPVCLKISCTFLSICPTKTTNLANAGSMESKYRDKAVLVLYQMYNTSNSLAEQHDGKNRGMAAGTAATFIGKGLDRVNRGRFSSDEFSKEEMDHILSMESSAEENKSQTSHFVDSMLEKLLKHAIPIDAPEREILAKKLRDTERNKKPNLSIKTIASNFKQLSKRMGGFFDIQYGLIRIVTWKQPSKTLSALVVYTATCMWPHLVLVYPLLFMLFGILVPGYVHRHPMRHSKLIPVKKRGQSLLSFFNDVEDESIVEELVDPEDTDSESLRPVSSTSTESTTTFTPDGEPIEKKDKMKHVKSQMALLINMRDLQNLTTDVLKGFEAADKFQYETAGFKDERLSTFIFYIVLAACGVVLFLGQFIPWRLIFIQAGWAGLILCHPRSKKYIAALSLNRAVNSQSPPPLPPRKNPKKLTTFERSDIIIDESPEERVVEVFELQMKSVLKTQWSFYRYTNNIFDCKNTTRLAGKRPNGVENLAKVYPVPGWKFDLGYANKWHIDTKPTELIYDRGLDPEIFHIKDDSDEGWIYDNVDDVDKSEIVYEFRRRRLSRECFRYGRPVKTKSVL